MKTEPYLKPARRPARQRRFKPVVIRLALATFTVLFAVWAVDLLPKNFLLGFVALACCGGTALILAVSLIDGGEW